MQLLVQNIHWWQLRPESELTAEQVDIMAYIKEIFYAHMHRIVSPNLFSYLRLTDTLDIGLTRDAVCSAVTLPRAQELALLLVMLLLALRWECWASSALFLLASPA